jgi:hypothetical protein
VITSTNLLWNFDPARAQTFVAEIVHVFQDRDPRHQTRRQRRAARNISVNRAEFLLQEFPIDQPR